MQLKFQLRNSIVAIINRNNSTELKSTPRLSTHGDSYDTSIKSLLRKLSFCSSKETQIFTLLSAIEAKDPYTKGHSESVAHYSYIIGIEMGLTQAELDKLQFAAFLHDVGKIMIDRRLLLKPSSLNETEDRVIKKHPEIGARILKNLCLEKEITTAVLHHHERWDGKGYPHNLFAYEIPFFARILSVADAFDAITSNRPYRQAKNINKALEELSENSGKQFDPEVVRAFSSGLKRNLL